MAREVGSAPRTARDGCGQPLGVKLRLARTADPDVDVDPSATEIDRPIQDLQSSLHLGIAAGEGRQAGAT